MNTLSYVARQFDVLATAKTSSTPGRRPDVPRVRSWTTRSLFDTTSLPRRSHSSPSFSSPTVTIAEQSKPKHLDVVLDRVFFIRAFLLLWDHLKFAWSSLSLRWPKAKESMSTSIPSPNLRSADPVLPPKKTPFLLLPKTLVLDLDETLIHSTSRPIPVGAASNSGNFLGLGTSVKANKAAGHVVEVVLGGRRTLYHVYKRPFVDFFLRTVSGWYTLVIFTASMREYADPVIDWLDAGRGILVQRCFRDSCTQLPNGSYTKDLTIVEADLSRVCLVDNSPVSYTVNEANGIPIEGWTSDPSDEALLDLLPVLDSLRFTSDVRRVLGLRRAGAHLLESDS